MCRDQYFEACSKYQKDCHPARNQVRLTPKAHLQSPLDLSSTSSLLVVNSLTGAPGIMIPRAVKKNVLISVTRKWSIIFKKHVLSMSHPRRYTPARSQETVSYLLFSPGCRQPPYHSSKGSRACIRRRHFLNSQNRRRDRSDRAASGALARLELRSHRKRPLVSNEASTILNAVLPSTQAQHSPGKPWAKNRGKLTGTGNRDMTWPKT